MKKLIILAAMAAVAVLLPGKTVAAINPLLINLTVSGTLEVETYTVFTNKTEINLDTSSAITFNNKYVYNLISNAVANAYTNLGPKLTPTNLPANGYIAFNINGMDDAANEGQGTFYVTNKSGFYFPLSGYDATNNYYSFIELDDNEFDFYNDFWDAENGGESDKTGKATYIEMEPSDFYVHDNPYSYDDADNPFMVYSNYMAIEIRSNLKATWYSTNNTENLTGYTATSTGGGCGNAVIEGDHRAAVITGKITLLP
jgi:hypothetical protein